MNPALPLTAAQFRPENDPRIGGPTGNWYFAFPGDPEVIVRGNGTSPDQADIERANSALSSLESLKSDAIRLLSEFMKEAGTWHLATLDCGPKTEKLECDFVFTFTFEADHDAYEYTYTYFDVCFVVLQHAHPVDRRGRPCKFVVGFY